MFLFILNVDIYRRFSYFFNQKFFTIHPTRFKAAAYQEREWVSGDTSSLSPVGFLGANTPPSDQTGLSNPRPLPSLRPFSPIICPQFSTSNFKPSNRPAGIHLIYVQFALVLQNDFSFPPHILPIV